MHSPVSYQGRGPAALGRQLGIGRRTTGPTGISLIRIEGQSRGLFWARRRWRSAICSLGLCLASVLQVEGSPCPVGVVCPEGGRSQYAGGGVTESTGLVLLGGGGGGGLTSLS